MSSLITCIKLHLALYSLGSFSTIMTLQTKFLEQNLAVCASLKLPIVKMAFFPSYMYLFKYKTQRNHSLAHIFRCGKIQRGTIQT